MKLALDLYAGTAGATAAFRDRGWRVVTVDKDPRHRTTSIADVTTWSWNGARPVLLWASPPCTEFSFAWHAPRPAAPSLACLEAAVRIIREAQPTYWVIENVAGAIRHFTHVLGMRRRVRAGPFVLWGEFPPFMPPKLPTRYKSICTGAEARARVPGLVGFSAHEQVRVARGHVPYVLSSALADAVEAEVALLGTERIQQTQEVA